MNISPAKKLMNTHKLKVGFTEQIIFIIRTKKNAFKVSAYPKRPHCVSTALLMYVYKKPPAKYIFSESLIIEDY